MGNSVSTSPPGYTFVISARLLHVIWALVGLGILLWRFRSTSIRSTEIYLWLLAAFVSFVVAVIGVCPDNNWDNNAWLAPAFAAALSVSAAGIALDIWKFYKDFTPTEKTFVFIVPFAAWFVVGALAWLMMFLGFMFG